MAEKRSPLRAFLCKQKKLARVVVTREDDEVEVAFNPNAHDRYKALEQRILATRDPKAVSCYDKAGVLLDSMTLVEDDEEEGGVITAEEAADRREIKAITRDHQALAAILDRYGARLNESFERGAEAANVSQANLVQLVQFLTESLANAITAFHRMAASYAHVMAGQEPPSSGSDDLMAKVLGGAVSKLIASGGAPAPAPERPNGSKRKEA